MKVDLANTLSLVVLEDLLVLGQLVFASLLSLFELARATAHGGPIGGQVTHGWGPGLLKVCLHL